MRRLAIFLLAVVVLFVSVIAWQSLIPSRSTASTVQVVQEPPVDGPRVTLTPAQRSEAAAAGGFERPPLSLLRVEQSMHYGEWKWNDAGVPAGPVSLRVDLRTQILSIFRGGHEIGTSVILYGADKKETPIGRFPVLWKGKDHRSSLYDAPMPFTLRLTGDGVSIHGSNVRWGAATHGCIGVPTDFASHLYAATSVSDPVHIFRSSDIRQPPAASR